MCSDIVGRYRTYVNYYLDMLGSIKFKLYSMNLEDVGTVDIGSRSEGTHTDPLTFPNLQAGTYYLNMLVDNVPEPSLFMIVKQ